MTAGFLARRALGTLAVLAILSIGVFGLLYLAPGTVERTLLGTRPASPEALEAIRARYHLNEPVVSQYLRWLGGVFQGDFGTSIRTGMPVTEAIGSRLGLTLQLTGYGTALAVLIGLPLGIVGAFRKGKAVDRAAAVTAVAGMSAPPFAAGLVLLMAFAVYLQWFPVYGAGEGFSGRLLHLTLPSVALAVGAAGLLVRFTRTALVRELDQDYIVFARARGLSPLRIAGYALRNSLIPILTAVGLILTSTLAGTVLIEVTFALPGLGSLLVDSVTFKDMPVVQALALLLTLLISLVNLLVDVAYTVADPRIRFGEER
ncbi:peptide/nickel transport system permease protein [Actinocorallia herbida]|uniref:Peptide/nickel transport system permease protein n=1 Tax=Actinocorallia herbida TaxID=58109 RepID=A0A3N1D616_9ACTN|nr:ABC transporter permease [Actinocorallia herbida]ROO88977.1 peptide/nickel transport system permease protein [Actinocorallia herbida]